MIRFNVKVENATKANEVRDAFCEALVGTPAFIDSQIAIVDTDENSDTSFYLLIGKERSGYDIESSMVIPRSVTDPILNVNLTCGGFIVPNAGARIKTFLSEDKQESLKKLCKLNGIEATGETIMVELWMHNDNSENVQDHGVTAYTEDGEEFRLDPGEVPCFWPVDLFKDIKEGDTIELKNEVTIKAGTPGAPSEDEDTLVKINIKMVPDQLKWRYKQYGPFEECLKKVIEATK